jgi:cell wall-associated NlpC family hydrolase
LYIDKLEKTFLLFIFTGLILITGCSSSSNTVRYGSHNDKKVEKENPVRYGKNEEAEPNESTISLETEETDPDETPDDLTSVDISVLKQKYNSMDGNSGITSGTTALRETMLMEIIKYMNTPYKFGGNSRDGIDCSAFTQTVYSRCSLQLLRSAREQFTQGAVIDKKEDLKFGDLVFFNTRKSVKPGHVGIYVGDNLFVHASRKSGVVVTPLTHDYYTKRYMGARRIEETIGVQ